MPHCWTARNLSPTLVYKLNTLLCLLSLISRMRSAGLPFFSPSVERLQTCQGTVTACRLLPFFLAVLISQAGRAEREQKQREIGELSQDIKSYTHCFLILPSHPSESSSRRRKEPPVGFTGLQFSQLPEVISLLFSRHKGQMICTV